MNMGSRRPSLGGIATVVLLACALALPFLTEDPFANSVANQVMIGVTAAFSVYLMLRMDLLTFAVPAFMAAGGYAAAMAGLRGGITDAIALTALSFIVPAILALPLGVLVLRLRGVYFVLVTFVLTEITQLLLFETPDLTGGSNGLVGMPPTTLFGLELGDNRSVLLLATGVAIVAAAITAVVAGVLRQPFAAIEENEVLAESLGLVVWRYKVIGFVIAAGLAGMAGFSLVNMLLTAHPTSFSPVSSVNYIAYAIVGGRASLLGPLIGSTLLVWMSNLFSNQGQYSPGLFGLLIIVVVLVAKGGIVGTLARLWTRLVPARAARANPPAAASAVQTGRV
jgi:branched-chain amino acid transport system permease protein